MAKPPSLSLAEKWPKKTGYKLEARNNKTLPITLYLQDQFPLSPNEDIVIERRETSSGNVNNETGIITWKVELKPGEQILRVMNYEVTYPKNSKVYF